MNSFSAKSTVVAALFSVTAFAASAATVQLPPPLVSYSVDRGEAISIKATPGAGNKQVWEIQNYRSNDGAFQLGAFMDPDPVINTAVNVVDTAAASNFNVSFALPIVPTTGAVTLQLIISASCTDAGNDGCSVTPNLSSGFLVDGLLDNLVQVSGGTAFSGPAGGSGFFPNTVYTVNLAAGPYNNLGLNLGFLGSGGNDSMAFTLSVEVLNATVPEPGSLALVGLAAAGALVASRRQKKA